MSEAFPVTEYDLQEHDEQPDLHIVDENGQDNSEIFNFIDLMVDLENAGFNEVELAFLGKALEGESVCIDELRRTEWAILCLEPEAYLEFKAGVPELKRRLATYLSSSGIRSHWTAKERANQVSYKLWLGKDTEISAIIERNTRTAKLAGKKVAKMVEKRTEPETDDFNVLLKFHYPTLLQIAKSQMRNHSTPVLSAEDIAQEVSLNLAEGYETYGKAVFAFNTMYTFVSYRLTDQLRVHVPDSRKNIAAGKHISIMFDEGLEKTEAFIRAKELFPRFEKYRLQHIVESIYNGRSYNTFSLYIEDLELFEPVSTTDTESEAIDNDEDTEVASLIEKYLATSRWPESKRERYILMAKRRFVDGISLMVIGQENGVSESRMSQIFNSDIVPTLQEAFRRHNLGGIAVG